MGKQHKRVKKEIQKEEREKTEEEEKEQGERVTPKNPQRKRRKNKRRRRERNSQNSQRRHFYELPVLIDYVTMYDETAKQHLFPPYFMSQPESTRLLKLSAR